MPEALLSRRAQGLNEDVRTLLAATVIDVCAAGNVPFCSISTVSGDSAVLAAAQGSGPHLAVGAVWSVGDVPPARQAIVTGRPVTIATLDDPRLTQGQRLSITGHADMPSLALVPLLAHGRAPGLLVLSDRRARDLGPEVARATPIARLAAHVLAQDERIGDLARSADDLALVLDADIEAQSRSAGPDQVLRVVARRLSELCAAPIVDISAVDAGVLHTLVAWSHGKFDREGRVAEGLLAERPLTQAVISTGRPEMVSTLEDPRLGDAERDSLRARGAQSALSIPLVSSGRVIGVAEVLDPWPHDFSEVQRPALVLGEIAAHLLNKALLLETLERRNVFLRELVGVGARVNASDRPEDMAAYVADRLLDVLEATYCEIHLAEHGTLRCLVALDRRPGAAGHGSHDSPASIFAGGPTVRSHEVLSLTGADDPRLTEDERRAWRDHGFSSQISLPLVVDTRLVGVVDVFHDHGRRFDDHLDFVRSAAQLLAGAFDNFRLLEQLSESNRQLSILAEAGLEFGSSLDLTEVLHSVAARMCRAASAARCDIYALQGEVLEGLVSAEGSTLDDGFPGKTYRLADFASVRRSIELGKPYVLGDIASEAGLTPTQRAENLHWRFSNLVELPLIDRGAAIGVATLFDLADTDVAQSDLLRGLAQIAAQAIANARTHAALDAGAARLRLINDAGFELASNLDLTWVLETVARRLCDVSGVDSCDVYTLGDRVLRCASSLVHGERDEDWAGRRLDIDDWRAARRAVESRSVVRATGRESSLAVGGGGRRRQAAGSAGLIVPLLVEQRVIGVAELYDSTVPAEFDDEVAASVEAVCRVAAMAIANAELYRDARLRTRESELLNKVAARAVSSLESRAIAASTVEELAALLPFTDACLVMDSGRSSWEVVHSTSPALEALSHPERAKSLGMLDRLRRDRVAFQDLTDVLSASAEVPALRLQAALLIGVFIDEALAGALVLGAPERDAFADADREVLERVGALLALTFKNARLYETIKTMHVANLKALITALNARDHYAVGHAARVAAYMLLLGRELDWPQGRLQQITEAAFLHDVGRIGISDDVLYKPGRLTDDEAAELRRHPIASAEIIQPLFSPDIVRAVRHHHERWDGTGYPDGLAAEQIPEIARALCIVDSYDAMSFQRQHHEALSYAECLSELERCRGSQFDPALVKAFMRVLDRLDERRLVARAASEQAASLVAPEQIGRLGADDGEASPEYQRLAKTLREVRDAHGGVRFLTVVGPQPEGSRMICDPEEDPLLRIRPGDLVNRATVSEDAPANEPDRNVLQLGDLGVWVSGTAEIRSADGTLVGLACADLAPADDWPADLATGASGREGTFSAVVESATARLGRARVDAVTDGLTGLYNQRYFKQRLAEEVERAGEQGRSLSLLFCDLDRFKSYNDRLGHVAGDKALRAVAGVVVHSIRQVDLAARYGGEELTVILLDTPGDAAVEVAERIRQGVSAMDLGEGGGITISIGAASYPEHAVKVEELLDKADWAMYLAKRRGRDRVVSFGHVDDDDAGPRSSAADPTGRPSRDQSA